MRAEHEGENNGVPALEKSSIISRTCIQVSLCAITMLLGAFTLSLFLTFFIKWADARDCSETANAMKLEHQYGFWNGCMIQLESGLWVKLENIQVEP